MESPKQNIEEILDTNMANRLLSSLGDMVHDIIMKRPRAKKVKIIVVKSTGKVEIPVRHMEDDREFYTFGGQILSSNPLKLCTK